MTDLMQMGKKAKSASRYLAKLDTAAKNTALMNAAACLERDYEAILTANEQDVILAKANGMKDGLVDRLLLTKERVLSMANGLKQVAALTDPIGEVTDMKKLPNGLLIGEKRVPLGVVGMIYEARPNVTADTFGLCFKTGNTAILKGGSDAIQSNTAIVKSLRQSLTLSGVPEDALQLIEDTNRETATRFMKMNEYLDILIPRGGAGLIKSVVENATVPVIETGTGNCHIYVDESADLNMAIEIIYNAKTQRIGVCNSCESLVIHDAVVKQLMPPLYKRLSEKQVEVRADERICAICPQCKAASEEDWGKEYLDYIISAKTVKNIDEAIEHINTYSTKHSEAIITNSYTNSQRFLDEIDAAAVYVNASTRYTDGEEFGLGAEIGISTQKLHARGPMGLKALTTTKFIIYGSGQVRP